MQSGKVFEWMNCQMWGFMVRNLFFLLLIINTAHVTEEFFSKGSHSRDFRNTLTEKIAQSKLEKLKRVEENEEQRDRLKTVDSNWSNKIRFLLSGISIKSKVLVCFAAVFIFYYCRNGNQSKCQKTRQTSSDYWKQ